MSSLLWGGIASPVPSTKRGKPLFATPHRAKSVREQRTLIQTYFNTDGRSQLTREFLRIGFQPSAEIPHLARITIRSQAVWVLI